MGPGVVARSTGWVVVTDTAAARAQWLPKCVLSPAPTYFGPTHSFALHDIELVLFTDSPCTLNDPDQVEELCLFKLRDMRIALVWVAHCNVNKCCGRCLGAIAGYVGSNGKDVMDTYAARRERK